jgi:bifunctional non-homologous end joining protein LigD
MPTLVDVSTFSLAHLLPMLCDERPIDMADPEWIFDLKYDGYRLLASISKGVVELRTRGGVVATAWFPEVTRELAKLPGSLTVLDGEVVVLDEIGRSDFDRLQTRARRRRFYPGADSVVFCAFDLLIENGIDLMQVPLIKRRARLEKLLKNCRDSVMVVGYFESHQAKTIFHEAVVPLKLEGLVAKRKKSIYVPGVRSADWVKVKRKGAIPAERFKHSKKG